MTGDKQHESAVDAAGGPAKGAGRHAGSARKGAAASTPSGGTSADENGRLGPERARRLADVPAKYRDLYRRAYAGKSRKAAIRAHCLECVYWSADEVRRCTAPACPLFEFRLRG